MRNHKFSYLIYQRLAHRFEGFDFVIADHLMECVNWRMERILFNFDGHKVKVRLFAGVVPACQFTQRFVAQKSLASAQRIEIGELVKSVDIFPNIIFFSPARSLVFLV